MKFYWFDSLKEYDKSIESSVYKLLESVYLPFAKKFGFEFTYIDTSEIIIMSSNEDKIIYRGHNLLEEKASVYISYTNPNSQIEKIHESLAIISDRSINWKIVNKVPKGLFLDKDKIVGIEFARKSKSPVIPTILIPSKSYYRSLIPIIETQLGGYPFLIKPKEMLAGLGIIKVETQEKLRSLLDIITQSDKGTWKKINLPD